MKLWWKIVLMKKHFFVIWANMWLLENNLLLISLPLLFLTKPVFPSLCNIICQDVIRRQISKKLEQFSVHWQPVHIATHFPVFHCCVLLDYMFFCFPDLVYSCMFLTEGPWGWRGLAVSVLPTCYFFARISRNREVATVWCPCHDPSLLLLEEWALWGWGSKNWDGGEGMMRGICRHKKRGKKCLCLKITQLELLSRIPLENKHLVWLSGLC